MAVINTPTAPRRPPSRRAGRTAAGQSQHSPSTGSTPPFCDVVAMVLPAAGATRPAGAIIDWIPPRRVLRTDGPVEPARAGRTTMRPRQVAVALLTALSLAALLDAGPMLRSAETSEFGTHRDLSLLLLRPLATVSHALGIDQPRAALDALAGHSGDTDPGSHSSSEVDQGVPLIAGDLRPVAVSAPAPDAQQQKHHAGKAIGPPPRIPTAQSPLRLWVGGDSVAGYFGFGMDDVAAASGVVAAHSHYKTSTGLSRPDYYDWPAHLEEDMRTYDPEVVAFLVGANDDQPLEVGGRVADFGSDPWKAEYARRVGAVMDRLLAERRHVVWVGQPVMRNAEFDARMQLMNAIYAGEARARPGVVFFDSRPVLADPAGHYSAYLADGSSAQTLMRAPDGIHLTPAGGRRLAQAVLMSVEQMLANPEPGGDDSAGRVAGPR